MCVGGGGVFSCLARLWWCTRHVGHQADKKENTPSDIEAVSFAHCEHRWSLEPH